MKARLAVLFISLALISCNGHAQSGRGEDFKSEKVSKTASSIVNSPIEKVFTLYGAFEERKWEPNWNPVLIYPDKEVIVEGTAFKTHGHGPEKEYLWIVTKYDVEAHLIQYLVSTSNRFWTITVGSESVENAKKTKTTVTYAYTSLNAMGHELNKKSLEDMYHNNLQDWAKALNKYLNE